MLMPKEFEQIRSMVTAMQTVHVNTGSHLSPVMVAIGEPMISTGKILEVLSKFVKYEPNREAEEFQEELRKA